MHSNSNEVELDSFVFALQKATTFESLLTKRFGHESGTTYPGEGQESCNKVRKFDVIVSSCSESHSPVFISAQEAAIQKLHE
jgi:hypothetical protein